MIEVDPVLIDVLQPDVWVEITYTLEEVYTGNMVEDYLSGYVAHVTDEMWSIGDEVQIYDGEECVVKSVRLELDI